MASAISAQSSGAVVARDVQAAVNRAFGSSVELVTTFDPYYATGDFNGDFRVDLLAVVRVIGAQPERVRTINPYRYTRTNDEPVPALAFAIIHGAGNRGWSAASPQAVLLVRGGSPVSVMDDGRSRSSNVGDRRRLIEVWRRGNRRGRPSYLPRTARGDAIVLLTEAAEGVLYWNGVTYVWREDPEGY